MRCPACGADNLLTNLFCRKCAASLQREKARNKRNTHVLLPPQDEVLVKLNRPTTGIRRLLLLIAVAVLCVTLVVYVSIIYG